MTKTPTTILFLARYYHNAFAAAAIRTKRLVDALTENGCKVILATVGDFPTAQKISDLLEIYTIDQLGNLPPEIHPAQVSKWPRSQTLPGPDPDPICSKALFSLGDYLLQQHQFNAVAVTAPPFGLCASAYQLALNFGKPLILDFRDAWHTHMPWPYPNRKSLKAAAQWEFQCIEDAAAIITATDTYRKLIAESFGQHLAPKIITVRHGFDPVDLKNNQKKPASSHVINKNQFNIAHIGQLRGIDSANPGTLKTIGRAISHPVKHLAFGATFCEQLRLDWMSPHLIIQAMAEIASVNREFKNHATLNFAGPIYPEIDQWAWDWNMAENVIQHGILPYQQAQQLAQDADLLILSLYGIKGCKYHWCVPSKIYSYLAAKKPILALLPPGEAQDIVTKAGLGFVAQPDNPQEIADTIAKLFNQHLQGQIKVTPNHSYIDQFNAERHKKHFADFIIPLLKQ